MTDGLFSAVELHDAEAQELVGYRLQRLELRNWGTFDRRVWEFGLDGQQRPADRRHRLGQVDVVDAITTLLLPANRIAYNKAAGAETRERSLRSYVLGYYKSERSEATGTSRPVGLRKEDSFSVVLGVFHNDGFDSDGDAGPGVLDGARATGTAGAVLRGRGPGAEHRRGLQRLRLRHGRPAQTPPGRRRAGARTTSPSTAGSTAAGWASSRSRRWTCSTRRCR